MILFWEKEEKEKKVSGIRVSTRPDYIDKEKLKLLKQYGVKTISLLTGFKFIGDKIHEFEIEENHKNLIVEVYRKKEEDADYNELLIKIEDMLKSVLLEEEYPEQVYFIDNKPIAHFKVDRKLLRKKYNITTKNS